MSSLSSPARGRLILAVLLALTTALLLVAPPATGAPPAPRAGRAWEVERTAGGWTVTWRADGPVPVRDDVPVLLADGRRVGVARAAAGGRTYTATTTDARVRLATSVTLGWASDGGAAAGRRAAGAGAGGWGAPTGPVLADDPAATGRYAVRTRDYDLGDRALALAALGGKKTELRGRVYLPVGASGRRPVVLFLHGMHSACYGGRFGPDLSVWPCPRGEKPVPNHLGYAAMARSLASRGYVVASLSANGVNVYSNADLDAGQRARGELVLASLDLVRRGGGGSGALAFLRGRVDLNRVGLMGHSRGGEGVARAALMNTQRAKPYGIVGLFLIAPTDFARLTVPGVSTGVLLPYCDGDVADLQGQHYLDDTRRAAGGDRSVKTGVLMLGANHNYFNTEWSPGSVSEGTDDSQPDDPASPCDARHPDRLTAAEQRAAGRAYLTGFFRTAVGRETRFLPLFDGTGARARSAGRAVVRTTYTAPAPDRVEVAPLNRVLPVGLTASGGARLTLCAGLQPVNPEPGEVPDPVPTTARGRAACSRELLTASSWSASPLVGNPPGTTVGHLRWTATGAVRLPLAAGRRDVRRADALRLLAAPDPGVAGTQDLTVRVVDGRGRSVRVRVGAVSDALKPLPGAGRDLPRTELRTVRVPVGKLRGLDLRDVRAVELVTDRKPRGAVYVSDVAFTRSTRGTSKPVRLPSLRLVGAPRVAEGPTGVTTAARFTAVLSRASDRDVTVEWSAFRDSGELIPPPAESVVIPRRTGRVRIPAGTTKLTVRVPVLGNDRDGFNQVALAGLSSPAGAVLGANTGQATVLDDDPAPTLRVGAATADEGAGVLRFPLTLSAASDAGVAVDAVVLPGTAVRGSDWQVEGEPGEPARTFGFVDVGRATGVIEVPLVDDRVAEPTETFRLQLGEVFNATVVGPRAVAGTIRDDD
ncbi:hypothetical protein SAMN04488543_3796 [Friedmanniella luteola]|uniref:Calx-beta domain-containing protein n=1 Tax=Friedmanniella luteola TaxID=546871 RepID=A0A1H1ZJR8_9ACTN|nr:hypothetical protein [Friedmanniella luteola]SDT33466.1 hypothetical protein SAMN04488543_3796 [Friedmanniella luteola]